MVTSGLSIKLFDFQEKAVIKLIDLTSKKDNYYESADRFR